MRYAYACAAIRQTSDKDAGQVCILLPIREVLGPKCRLFTRAFSTSPYLTPQALPQLFNDDLIYSTKRPPQPYRNRPTPPKTKPNHAAISNHRRRRRRRRRGSLGKRRRRRSSSRKKAHHLATNPRKPPSTPPPPPKLTIHPTYSSSRSPYHRTPSPPQPRQPSSPPSAPPASSTSPTTPSPPPSSPASSPSQPNSSRSLNAAKTRWRGRPRARIADTCAWGGRK